MSVTYEEVKSYKVATIQCDKCKSIITKDNFIEWQEVIHLSICGGYGSVFGDMVPYTLDLCQRCAYKLLSPYIQEVQEEKAFEQD